MNPPTSTLLAQRRLMRLSPLVTAPATAKSDPSLTPPGRVLSTLNEDGSRRWLKPRPMPGRFLSARRIVAYLLILIFTAIPYISLNGRPLVLLDLPTRHFTIFGMTFLPTDTLLLAFFVVGIFVSVFLLTALLGRIWCGWACPQTVYLEFVFRPIERFFEGVPGRRKRRWQGTPVGTVAKYALYLVVSLYLAHTFLAYFVGVERLAQWVTQSPFDHPAPFVVMLVVTALMLFDFSFFREQTCIVACPYGRMQSVMLDRNSLIVTYDQKRGEPRGSIKRARTSGGADVSLPVVVASGDCIDCGMCTVCCPTGIDIREGLQMECVGCAQCIDACDAVMTKINRPKGLIRYSSQAAISGESRRLLRPRVVLYPLVLLGLLVGFLITLSFTGGFDLTVLRGLGSPFTERPDGTIGNTVKIKIVNRRDTEATYAIVAEGVEGLVISAEENPVTLAAGEVRTVPITLAAPRAAFDDGTKEIVVTVTDDTGQIRTRPFQLVGPAAGLKIGP